MENKKANLQINNQSIKNKKVNLQNQDEFDNFQIELRKCMNMYTEKDFDDTYGFFGSGRSIYYNLFKEPVKRLYYYSEEFYSGSIIVLYEYKGVYIVVYGSFGSCHVCDSWEGINNLQELRSELETVFARMEYYNSIDEIRVHTFYSDEIRSNFNEFKIYGKEE